MFNPKHTLICGEQCIPERHYGYVFELIFDEFDFFFKYRQKFPEITHSDSSTYNSYLFKGILDMIYRYLQGIRLNFYNFMDIPDKNHLKEDLDHVIEQLKKLDENDPE